MPSYQARRWSGAAGSSRTGTPPWTSERVVEQRMVVLDELDLTDLVCESKGPVGLFRSG